MAICEASARGHSVEDTVGVLLRFESGAVRTLIDCDDRPSPLVLERKFGREPDVSGQLGEFLSFSQH
jgi:hypothetical protein